MSYASPEAPSAAAYLWCSDCRAPMRDRYFALNERPICYKCRPSYARRIARSDGPGAIWRVGLQGALVALVGAIVLTGVITVWPPARIFFLVPIGYLLGKRMMKSLEGYSNRRYQYLAVALTYLCFLVGFAVPAGMEQSAARERREENRQKVQGTMAGQADAMREAVGDLSSPFGDSVTGRPAPAPAPSRAADDAAGPGAGLGLAMLLVFPVIAMVQFGMAFSGMGLLSLGYALYQAWHQTDGQGMHLALSGPFRVGEGPIAAR